MFLAGSIRLDLSIGRPLSSPFAPAADDVQTKIVPVERQRNEEEKEEERRQRMRRKREKKRVKKLRRPSRLPELKDGVFCFPAGGG